MDMWGFENLYNDTLTLLIILLMLCFAVCVGYCLLDALLSHRYQ